MNVLVTGASGFVGRQLVPALAAAGHTQRLLLRTISGNDTDKTAQALFGANVTLPAETFVAGTLPDTALCSRLCAGIDVVIHAAGVAHVAADPESLRRQNLDATVELAGAAKAAGVKRFIFLSSSKARYAEHSAYARFKAEAETALRAMHAPGAFEVVCVRPALVYGPHMRGNLRSLLRMLARPWLPAFPASSQKIGMISVADLSRALVCAVQADLFPDAVWELSDGQAYTLTGLVKEVRGALGLPQPTFNVPPRLVYFAAAVAPLFGSSVSLATYRTLCEESYEHDPQFSHHTGFAPQDTFFSRMAELLEAALG